MRKKLKSNVATARLNELALEKLCKRLNPISYIGGSKVKRGGDPKHILIVLKGYVDLVESENPTGQAIESGHCGHESPRSKGSKESTPAGSPRLGPQSSSNHGTPQYLAASPRVGPVIKDKRLKDLVSPMRSSVQMQAVLSSPTSPVSSKSPASTKTSPWVRKSSKTGSKDLDLESFNLDPSIVPVTAPANNEAANNNPKRDHENTYLTAGQFIIPDGKGATFYQDIVVGGHSEAVIVEILLETLEEVQSEALWSIMNFIETMNNGVSSYIPELTEWLELLPMPPKILYGLPTLAKQALVHTLRTMIVPQGQLMGVESCPASSLYVLVSGTVYSFRRNELPPYKKKKAPFQFVDSDIFEPDYDPLASTKNLRGTGKIDLAATGQKSEGEGRSWFKIEPASENHDDKPQDHYGKVSACLQLITLNL